MARQSQQRLDPLNGRSDGRRADRLLGSAAGLHVVVAGRTITRCHLADSPAGDVAAHDDHVRLIEGAGVEELGPDLRAVTVGDVDNP
jgi:hypothetical protein